VLTPHDQNPRIRWFSAAPVVTRVAISAGQAACVAHNDIPYQNRYVAGSVGVRGSSPLGSTLK
jgi:hypothetical protein